MENNDLSERLNRMLKFLNSDPSNLSLFSECFDLSMRLGDFEKAQDLVDDALKLHPNEHSVYFEQSKIYLALGNYEDAVSALNSIREQGTNNSGIVYNLAWAKLNLAQYEAVIQEIDQASQYINEYPALLLVKVRALHHLQEMQAAIENVNIYLEIDPENAEANGLKAMLLLDSAMFPEAKIYAEKALKHNPYNHEALITFYSLALNEQDPDKAITYLTVQKELTGKSGRLMLNLGQTHMLNMQFEEAEKALKEAGVLMAGHIGTWHALAWAEIILNKIDDAKRCFERAMELDRNFSESHGGLAVIAALQDDLALAEKLAKKAVRLDPQSVSGRYAESLILDKQGKPEAAKSKVTDLISSAKAGDGQSITALIQKANERLSIAPSDETLH